MKNTTAGKNGIISHKVKTRLETDFCQRFYYMGNR